MLNKKIIYNSLLLLIANLLAFVGILQENYISIFSENANMILTFSFGYFTIALGLLMFNHNNKKIFNYFGILGFLIYFILYIYWELYFGVVILLFAGYLAIKTSKKG